MEICLGAIPIMLPSPGHIWENTWPSLLVMPNSSSLFFPCSIEEHSL